MVAINNKLKSCSDDNVIQQLRDEGRGKKVFIPAEGKPKNGKKLSEKKYYPGNDAQSSLNKDCTYVTKFMNDGSQENIRSKERRVPVCRLFFRGFCERGNSCCFNHCEKRTTHPSQKVFICDLPPNTTEVALRRQLTILGFSVINKNVSIHKSWPCVEFGSPNEAQKFIKKGIMINGSLVKLCSWKFVAERYRTRIADISRRSIFLGGLAENTTCKAIRLTLENIGVKVVNLIKIKRGFCPKVTLSSVKEKELLVLQRKIKINGSMVEFLSYVPKRLI